MISVKTFDTLAEAQRAMQDRTCFLGGGTLIMRAVNYGDQSFNRIVRCRDGILQSIRTEGGRVVIGAGVTMSRIMATPETAFLAPPARVVGGPAIRNMATVGGNLFALAPYGDFAAALLAVEARVQFADGSDMPLEELLARRGHVRQIVRTVSAVRPSVSDEFRFRKVSRVKPKGVSIMSIAAWLPSQGGRLRNVRIAFGAMGPAPMRARSVEQALEGATLDRQGIAGALDALSRDLNPQDDALASAWYRREVAPVHLRRLLLNEG